MEDIELSTQSSRRTYPPSQQADAASNLNVYKTDTNDDDMTAASSRMSRESISPTTRPNDIQPKKTLSQRLKAKIPPLPLIRTIVKASTAILIALLFVFVDDCRNAMGQASIMVPIVTLLNFPVRPLGVQIEGTIVGLFGALVGAAWSFLGMFLGNLARDSTNPSPVQPHSSAVLSIMMFIGVYGLTYIRTKFAQANFACIFAGMIIAFSFTQASILPGFQPTIVYTFLKPMATAGAVALMVDMFLWPEDSITKFMGVLNLSLKEYNSFFQEHSNAFLSVNTSPAAMTLPSLHARLQNSILKLIDCKREVQREILFNRLSQDDISSITRLVKTMRSPLHGIGLSLITKSDRLKEMSVPYFAASVQDDHSEHKRQFLNGLEELRKVSQELTDTCVMTLGECNERLMKFSGKPRSWKSTLLWPFPRIYLHDYYRSKREIAQEQQDHVRTQSLSERLDQVIAKYEAESKEARHIFIEPGSDKFEMRFNSILQVIYLFQYNLLEHASNLRSLVACVESIEATRVKRRLWLPRLKLRKWFRSLNVNANIGGQVGSATNGADLNNTNSGLNNDLTLSQTMTRPENLDSQEDINLVCRRNRHGKAYPRDPDVNCPENAVERFFYGLHKVEKWFTGMEAMFALKTAGGFTLISLPAYLPQSASWFFAWRGQWATITLMLWMFPMAGMFFFTVILRVAGTVLGGVLGIIIWEIVRGNPYGLVAVSFVVMIPLYYIFFTSQIFNIVAIMTQVTYILVICYEYQYVVSGAATYDSVEVVAGKRMLLVIIGVGAAAFLSVFPKPVTGRVELRKRISRTLYDLGKVYGILMGDIMVHAEPSDDPTPGQQKAFQKLILNIRRQIADEHTYLKISKLEPPMRGKFPIEVYSKLVEKVDNMSDLLQGMAFALRSIDKKWKANLAIVIKEEQTEYAAAVLAILKLLSATLASKMSLPPFMLSPIELRRKLQEGFGASIARNQDTMDNDTFPSFCAYAINSSRFSSELAEALVCIEELVGVEDPEQWLFLNA